MRVLTRAAAAVFSTASRRFQGKLALILQDLFPLPSRGAHVFAVTVHQANSRTVLKYWKHWRRGARVVSSAPPHRSLRFRCKRDGNRPTGLYCTGDACGVGNLRALRCINHPATAYLHCMKPVAKKSLGMGQKRPRYSANAVLSANCSSNRQPGTMPSSCLGSGESNTYRVRLW